MFKWCTSLLSVHMPVHPNHEASAVEIDGELHEGCCHLLSFGLPLLKKLICLDVQLWLARLVVQARATGLVITTYTALG